jgi:hypothetical protein
MPTLFKQGWLLLSMLLCTSIHAEICHNVLTKQQQHAIAELIFQNECNLKRDCLVDWNQNEAFPSLGIGHFIWYPAGIEAGFTESFPMLIEYLKQHGTILPAWLTTLQPFDAPWANREQFLLQRNAVHANSLRQFLAEHSAQQMAFMQHRMQQSLLRIARLSQNPTHFNAQVSQLCQTPQGIYALIDYVNFKGEGLSTSETYQGHGWGLKQVLEGMPHNDMSIAAFVDSADRILTRRADNAPNPHELEKWLPGWRKRLNTYRYAQIPKQ